MRISNSAADTSSWIDNNQPLPEGWVDPNPKRVFKPGQHFHVAFDVDGIVLDTPNEMWRVISQHFGMPASISILKEYDIGKAVGIKSTQELRPLYDPILARCNLPAIAGAAKGLNAIAHKYDKPLLFVTARRAQHKYPAASALFNLLDNDVEFELLCLGEIYGPKKDDNKTDLLKECKISLFVEDNPLFWETYIDNGINVATLDWPWTRVASQKLYRDKGKDVPVLLDWGRLTDYIMEYSDKHGKARN